jgi:hypothetical protein
MISYNALIIWVPLIVFLLFVFNRWNEKRLIRQVEKILSPVKKDVLFEAPKLHLQHLKQTPMDVKSTGYQANVNQTKVNQIMPASAVKFDDRAQERTLEVTDLENIKPVQSAENKITKHSAENLVSTHREIDVAFDEMLENMAKRAAMRKK